MMMVLTSFSNAAHDWMVESSMDCFFLPDLLGCSPLVVTTLGFFFTSVAAAEKNNILVNIIKGLALVKPLQLSVSYMNVL